MNENMYNRHDEVNWKEELDQFFSMPKPNMTKFSKGKPYTYWNLQSRVRKDPRYLSIKKSQIKHTAPNVELQPIIVPSKSHTVRINGFDIEIDDHTDPKTLSILLDALRTIE